MSDSKSDIGGQELGVAADAAGLSPSVEPLRVSPADAASIPNAETEAFIAGLTAPLEAMVRKFADEAYGVILYNLQDYLRDNAVYNIKAAFDTQERDRVTAYRALLAVETSESFHEARQHAYAARKGYWRPELAEQFKTEAAALARGSTPQ